MSYDAHPRRRSIRLRGYDYAQAGAYFVTICAYRRLHLFGEVVGGEMILNGWGQVVQSCWDAIPAHFPSVELDACVIMPNHMHGILVITDTPRASVGAQYIAPLHGDSLSDVSSLENGATPNNVSSGSLGAIVRSFKAAVTRMAGSQVDSPIWQRNYYDHIIRNAAELDRIRSYIVSNPSRWQKDSLYSTG